jgi:hypothetical protein
VKRDGPQSELTVMFDKETRAPNLRFTAAESLVDQVEKAVAKDSTAAARVVGTVFAPEGKEGRCTVEIEEVRLLAEDGTVKSSLKPFPSAQIAKAPAAKAETPAAPVDSPAVPVTVEKPAEPAASSLPPMPVLIAGGVALVLAGIGVGVLVSRRGRLKGRPFPPPSSVSHASSVLDTPLPGASTSEPVKKGASRRVRF